MDHLQWIMQLQDRQEFPRLKTLAMTEKSPAEHDGQADARKMAASAPSAPSAVERALEELEFALLLHGSLQAPAGEKTAASAAETAPERAAYAHAYGGAALGAGPSMAEISRFFERDARRFG